MTPYEALNYRASEALVTIELNRPPHNILDIALMRELGQAVGRASADETAKVLVITGAGEKFFSAGVDVLDHTPDKAALMIHTFHGMLNAILACPIPTIAVVNGAALGGGCELAICCDMQLAKEGAKIGQPEIKLGVFPPVAAILLPRMVPANKGVELLLGGGVIAADEARRIGLVNQVYPAASFASDCAAFAGQFLSLSRVALTHTKRAMREASGKPFADALGRVEKLYLEDLMATADAQEGLNSFIEKRKPVWTDR